MSSKCDCCDPFELGENREVISPHSLLFPSLNQNLICEAFDLYHTHRRSNPSHLAHLTSPITSHFSPLLITSQTSLMTPHTSDLRPLSLHLRCLTSDLRPRPQTFVHISPSFVLQAMPSVSQLVSNASIHFEDLACFCKALSTFTPSSCCLFCWGGDQY